MILQMTAYDWLILVSAGIVTTSVVAPFLGQIVTPFVTKVQFYVKYMLHRTSKLPEVRVKERNALLLCHGTSHGSIMENYIDYLTTNVYTVDVNPDVNPLIVRNLIEKDALVDFPSDSFDVIALFACYCHTKNLIDEAGNRLITGALRLLKPGGSLYIKSYHSFSDQLTIPDGLYLVSNVNGYAWFRKGVVIPPFITFGVAPTRSHRVSPEVLHA
jgi:SAM-dependent methyltransferase